MQASFKVSAMGRFFRELRRQSELHRKAAYTAVRVEGYRLMRLLQAELRAGQPGGKRLRPLRKLTTGGRHRPPLARMAKAIRYSSEKKGGRLTFIFGVLRKKSSESWIRIADKQQAGFTVSTRARTPIGSTYGTMFARLGARMGNRAKTRRFYFLRRYPGNLKTPAREFIRPFWQAHEREAAANIVTLFKRKLRGERI